MARGPGGKAKSAGNASGWPEVAQGQAGPLYAVFGEEDFLLNQAVQEFISSPSFSQNLSLNIERFQAGDSPPGRVLESARTIPFLGSRRLVICTELENYKAAHLNELADYLAEPVTSTCLLLCGRKLDSRTKFAKSLKKNGKVRIIKKMYPRELLPWLSGQAALRGKRLARPAAEHLAELAGLGLGALDSELEKISLYVGQRREISLEDVLAVVGRGRLYSIFDFTDAVASGALHRALTSWDQLHSLGEPAVRVVAMISRLLRQLLQVKEILDQGGGQGQVQSTLRIPPAATQTLLGRARRESVASLAALLSRVLEADAALKSSPGSDRVIMERLVMDLCRS